MYIICNLPRAEPYSIMMNASLMHIIEFSFLFFISVLVLADMKCPHIGISRYAFFHIETALMGFDVQPNYLYYVQYEALPNRLMYKVSGRHYHVNQSEYFLE